MNTLEQEELFHLGHSDHLEQVYGLINNLRVVQNNKQLVYNNKQKQLEAMNKLIDPDKFPIFSLIENINQNQVSLWKDERIEKKLEKKQGFRLICKQSSLEHHEAGEGVFLFLDASQQQNKIPPGKLLGFVPGLLFDSLIEFRKFYKKEKPFDSYLHRYDNTIVDFSSLMYYPNDIGSAYNEYEVIRKQKEQNNLHDTINKVPPEMINPYALGHKINHPLKGKSSNVVFLDILVPKYFFTDNQNQFIPNLIAFDDHEDQIALWVNKNINKKYVDYYRTVGIFSSDFIQDGQELFVDYIENEMYDLNTEIDWLSNQKTTHPLLSKINKNSYDTQFTIFHEIVSTHVLSQYLKIKSRQENNSK